MLMMVLGYDARDDRLCWWWCWVMMLEMIGYVGDDGQPCCRWRWCSRDCVCSYDDIIWRQCIVMMICSNDCVLLMICSCDYVVGWQQQWLWQRVHMSSLRASYDAWDFFYRVSRMKPSRSIGMLQCVYLRLSTYSL